VLAGYNDLVTTHPELSKEAVGWDPTTVIAGSHKKMKWQCGENHEWVVSVGHRALSRSGCPVCAGQQVLAGYNDLVTTHPELSKEAVGWDPTTVIAGSGKKMKWRCGKDHEWHATVYSRALNYSGCPICAGQQVLVGYNDLVTTHPELSKEAVGWDPATVVAGSNKKMKWQCGKDHKWVTNVNNRALKGRGCPSCAIHGFDPNLPSWLYFIEHDGLGMLQIGITNYPDSRLGQHARVGWEPLEIRGPMDGSLTRNLETDILRSLIRRGALFANKTSCLKFDGWSEAWTKSSLPVTSLKELLEFVYTDDQ
jgi:tRNA(Arg) A34 adenosine deaminase TadA